MLTNTETVFCSNWISNFDHVLDFRYFPAKLCDYDELTLRLREEICSVLIVDSSSCGRSHTSLLWIRFTSFANCQRSVCVCVCVEVTLFPGQSTRADNLCCSGIIFLPQTLASISVVYQPGWSSQSEHIIPSVSTNNMSLSISIISKTCHR